MVATKKSSISHIRRTPSYGASSFRLFVKVLRGFPALLWILACQLCCSGRKFRGASSLMFAQETFS